MRRKSQSFEIIPTNHQNILFQFLNAIMIRNIVNSHVHSKRQGVRCISKSHDVVVCHRSSDCSIRVLSEST